MCHQLGHEVDWFSGKFLLHAFGFHGIVDFKQYLEDSYAFVSDKKSLVVYGRIYSLKGKALNLFGKNIAETLLSLYEKDGLNFLNSINGLFALSIYDEEKDKFIIATDRYGSRNVFYNANADNILFSSEIKGITSALPVKPKLNTEAIGEFFTFSYLLGNKTLFTEIEVIPPASILTYDFKANRINTNTYWDFKFNSESERGKNLDDYLKEFNYLMKVAVERSMMDKDKIGVFLSGGVDSRLLVGFAKMVAGRMGKEVISYTFGTEGCYQQKIALAVANELKIKNVFFEIPPNSIATYAEEVVYKGDGHIRIRDAHFISSLSKVRAEVDTTLMGIGCDTAFGANLSKGLLKISNKNDLLLYLLSRFRVKEVAEHIPHLFTDNFVKNLDLEKEVMKEFLKSVREIDLNRYEDIVYYWVFRQRFRRYSLPLAGHIEWYLDVRYPFLDNDIVNFALTLPLELRLDKKFIYKALRYCFPSLAKIPLEATGTPPDTYALPILFSKIMRHGQYMLKDLIQKVSLGKVIFRPKDYRGYDYWLRTGSRQYVEKVLLREDRLKVFDENHVRKILKEHITCRRNHDQLICDILNIKLLIHEMYKDFENKA